MQGSFLTIARARRQIIQRKVPLNHATMIRGVPVDQKWVELEKAQLCRNRSPIESSNP